MAMIAGDIKGMLTIKIKPRHDGMSDQYSRIFMVKILLISSFIMSISWYKDSIQCIVPDSHGIDGGFVSATCWIQGVYVYRELIDKIDMVAYYGMPKNMDNDGMLKGTEELCSTQPKLDVEPSADCIPMTKTFFLQYQYMPFLIAALAMLYYIPYIAYIASNQDMILLRKDAKDENADPTQIAKHYFNHKINPPRTLAMRVLMNVIIKALYFAANLISFLGLNSILNDNYIQYGTKWSRWSVLDNHIAHDYMGMRDFPKPGNHLLPPFGYCEMYESARDVKHTLANQHKFVCELSQNILYQYALLVLWFCVVMGIIISGMGLIVLLVNYAVGLFGARPHGAAGKKIFKALTFREIEYLEYLRKKNIVLYQEVLEQVKERILGPNAPSMEDGYPLDNLSDKRPLYPSLPRKDVNG